MHDEDSHVPAFQHSRNTTYTKPKGWDDLFQPAKKLYPTHKLNKETAHRP